MIALMQRALRAAFMAAEGLFNRAFGDRLNPLYHLGAITFFLFWVVGATGLVLYAFFDTSVEGAHRSMEALEQTLWGAGGVLRTVHRHASDALVLTMSIHALRYFAFDQHLLGRCDRIEVAVDRVLGAALRIGGARRNAGGGRHE